MTLLNVGSSLNMTRHGGAAQRTMINSETPFSRDCVTLPRCQGKANTNSGAEWLLYLVQAVIRCGRSKHCLSSINNVMQLLLTLEASFCVCNKRTQAPRTSLLYKNTTETLPSLRNPLPGNSCLNWLCSLADMFSTPSGSNECQWCPVTSRSFSHRTSEAVQMKVGIPRQVGVQSQM